MKIVFLNDGIYGYASGAQWASGGAERQQWLLARALLARGWSVSIGVRDGIDAGEHKTIDGLEFAGLDRGQVLRAWYRFLSSERPDWLYWRCVSHLLGPVVEIAKRVGIRTVFAAAFDSDVYPRRALPVRRRWWPLYAWGLLRTDRIFLQHGGQLTALPTRWRSKAFVIPSIAAEASCVKPHAERGEYVAWVGSLRQPKRPDVLIEMARKTPGIRYVVCGGPQLHRSLPGYGERILDALRALPNVECLGQVAPEVAQRVIADAAVLVSTSDEEGFPNTFLQAWSSGTPVVSLNVDPDHVIEKVGLGMVSHTVEAAIDNITTLIDSPQRRDEIAGRARAYVARAHSATAVTRLLEAAIR